MPGYNTGYMREGGENVRRVILILTVALVMVAMLVINALPAAAQVEGPEALLVERCHQQAQTPEQHAVCTFLEEFLL
jgi:hypothetical protein